MVQLIGRVKKLENVKDEGARQYYKKEVIAGKETGMFIVDIPESEGYAFENVMALKSAAARERETNEGLRNKLNAFKDDKGELMDAVKVARELTELTELRKGIPDSDAEKRKWENKERELTVSWQSKFDTQKDQIETLDTENRELHVTHKARTALTKAGVLPDWEEMMLGHMEKVMRVKKNSDGKRYTRIIGDGGAELPSMKPGSTDPMGEEEYVARNLVPRYLSAFKAPDAAGSGAPGGDKDSDAGDLTTHQIAREDARDPIKYETAKAAAIKAGVDLEIVE